MGERRPHKPSKKQRTKSWTNPLCLYCWYASQRRVPRCVTDAPAERCCDCGRITRDGLYVERDPATVLWNVYEGGEG